MLDAGPFLTGNSNADPELNTTGSFPLRMHKTGFPLVVVRDSCTNPAP